MRSVWPSGKEQYQVTTNWYIGSSNGNSRFFDGEIREVAIWDSALNAAQAAAVYAGTTPSADYPTVVTSYTYDAAGHILTLTDPVGNTTSYTYNYMGLVATETNEKNATRYYSYDALGRLVSKTDRNGRITTYTYDTIGRLTAENWSNTTNYFMYTYDAVGNLLYATDGQHSYSYTYDALNRPIYTTFNFDSQSAVFAYTYDLAGRRTSSSLSLNGHSDRVNQVTYDFLGNATKITQTGSAVDEIFAEFDYNANGLMTSVKRYEVDGNNLINEIAESLYTYNANNAVTSITHKNPNGTQIVQHSYTYDSTNNIVEYLNSIDGQTSYDYDFLGQLIGADYSNQNLDDETYAYDENGNRITANGYTYTTGDNNELTSDGTWTYTYDAEGNRISKTNATNRELYTWDHRNRLTTVAQQEWDSVEQDWTTTQIVEYAYDYNNVWIRKVIGTDKTIFIPENYQTTVQIDNGTTTHHYLWTPNQQDKLLADTTTSGILWALTDHLGTIRDVLDGNSSTHLIYDAFGNLTSGTNPLLFGYTGKAFDADTALQNNINRWYDATSGRWLSTDPIGFYGNDTNLYRYVENSPIDYWDFVGLLSQRIFEPGLNLYSTGEEFSFLFYGLGFYLETEDIVSLKAQIPFNSSSSVYEVGGLILYNKMEIEFTTCKSQEKYNYEREGWYYTPVKMNASGGLVTSANNTHDPSTMQMENGDIAASYLLFSFDPKSLQKYKKYLNSRNQNRNGEMYQMAKDECNEIRKSKGTITYKVEAKLFIGNLSQGFRFDPSLKNLGTANSGQSMTDFNNRGMYSQIIPEGWKQTGISQTSSEIKVFFDCCSGTCNFIVTGPLIPIGSNRREDMGRRPGIQNATLQIAIPDYNIGQWRFQ